MRASFQIGALVLLAISVLSLAWLRYSMEVAPPAPLTYIGASHQISGRQLVIRLRASDPDPCPPISLQFLRAETGVIYRVPAVRAVVGTDVTYEMMVPAYVPAGRVDFWARETFECGSYSKIDTPVVAFWMEG